MQTSTYKRIIFVLLVLLIVLLDYSVRMTVREAQRQNRVECLAKDLEQMRKQLLGEEDAVSAEPSPEEEAKRLAEEEQRKKDEEARRRKEEVEGLLASMVDIPGTDYKMGKTEVTQAQWDAVTGENPSKFVCPSNPVEKVSWDDCQKFLELLNGLPAAKDSGLMFRLPTSEEWEFACRAGSTGAFCRVVGETEITEKTLGEVACFKDNSDWTTHPVGQRTPNAFGLFDMHGNVFEWTSTADGDGRVYRGGSWCNLSPYCESSYRISRPSSLRLSNIGLRLCASERPPEEPAPQEEDAADAPQEDAADAPQGDAADAPQVPAEP